MFATRLADQARCYRTTVHLHYIDADVMALDILGQNNARFCTCTISIEKRSYSVKLLFISYRLNKSVEQLVQLTNYRTQWKITSLR